MVCRRCKNEIAEDSCFCPNCGKRQMPSDFPKVKRSWFMERWPRILSAAFSLVLIGIALFVAISFVAYKDFTARQDDIENTAIRSIESTLSFIENVDIDDYYYKFGDTDMPIGRYIQNNDEVSYFNLKLILWQAERLNRDYSELQTSRSYRKSDPQNKDLEALLKLYNGLLGTFSASIEKWPTEVKDVLDENRSCVKTILAYNY